MSGPGADQLIGDPPRALSIFRPEMALHDFLLVPLNGNQVRIPADPPELLPLLAESGNFGVSMAGEPEPDLFLQERKRVCDARLAVHSERAGEGARSECGVGAERERLQDVGAAADSPVDEHVAVLADLLDYRRQGIGTGKNRVELPGFVRIQTSVAGDRCLRAGQDALVTLKRPGYHAANSS